MVVSDQVWLPNHLSDALAVTLRYTVLHTHESKFLVNLHAKFFPSNIEPWLVFMYLLSYRDRCFWRIDDIDKSSMTFNSMRTKIIISCSVAQRYHGVFPVLEFDWFFSEPTIHFFSGPRGRFFSELTPQEVRKRGIAALLADVTYSQLIQPSGCHLCNMPKHKRLSSIHASLTGYRRDPSRDTVDRGGLLAPLLASV